MKQAVSIAIETSCRRGGVALGLGEELAEVIDFDASSRHATQLVFRLRELLERHRLRPADLDEVYVSAGPGSFTGVRVGVTVARTLAQAMPTIRCVCVSSPLAVMQNVLHLPWANLGVVLDAKDDQVYTQVFVRETLTPHGPPDPAATITAQQPALISSADFLARTPRPMLVVGEGLAYHSLNAPGVTAADPTLNFPTPAGVWAAGRRLARQGQFTDYHLLLPIYARKSEAERLWDLRHGQPV